MQIALLGANGFIGRNLAASLAAHASWRVSAFTRHDRYPLADMPETIVHESLDLTDAIGVRARDWSRFDTIIWAASATKPADQRRGFEFEAVTNLHNLGVLIDTLVATNYAGLFVLFSSGGTVYGAPHDRTPITEATPLEPIGIYGWGKAAAESMLRAARHTGRFDFIIVRPSNPVGRWQSLSRNQGLIPAALRCVLEGTTLPVFGDGGVVRDYLDVSDLSAALARLLATPAARNLAVNIGSGQGKTINDVLAEIERTIGKDVRRTYAPIRPFDIPWTVLDTTLLKRLTGGVPATNLHKPISDLWAELNG